MKNDSSIVVGADSRVTGTFLFLDKNGNSATRDSLSITDKIGSINHNYFAIGGNDDILSKEMLLPELKRTRNLNVAASNFISNRIKPLAKDLEKFRVTNPSFYTEYYYQKPALSIVLFNEVSGNLNLVIIQVFASNRLNEPVKLDAFINIINEINTPFAGGPFDRLDAEELIKLIDEKKDPAKSIYQFILKQTTKFNKVGEPVKVVTLNKNGKVTWFKNFE